jgi:gamma-glutamylputrescine oxidase
MNLSFWERTSFFEEPDYAIIGAGIVGLFAALTIKENQPTAKVLVLERGILPDGASTKNAGFACFGSLTEIIDQLNNSSETEIIELVGNRIRGLKKLTDTVGAANLQLENFGGYEIFQSEDEDVYQASLKQQPYINALLQDVLQTKEDIFQIHDHRIPEFGFNNVSHLYFNPFESQIHSGKMMRELLRLCHVAGVQTIFNMEVQAVNDEMSAVEISCKEITIKAQTCIVCSNAFVRSLIPNLDVSPGRGQVLITNEIPSLPWKGSFHYDHGYYYFRNVNNRILLGGGRNEQFQEESTTEFGTTNSIQNSLEKMLREIIAPKLDYVIEMKWSGIMAFGNELSPIKKQISKNLYSAVRCNGMGVAMGSQLGTDIAHLAMH